jgi:PAS domain S-box-containing protein
LNLFAAFTAIFTVIASLFSDFYLIPSYFLATSALIFLLFFYLSFFNNIHRPLIVPFYVLVFVELFVNWLSYQGFSGSTPYFILIALSVFIFGNMNGRYWQILSAFVCFSLVLIGIQFWFPDWIMPYTSYENRFIDVSLGFLISLILLGLATIFLKKEYDKARAKTEKRKQELEESEARFRDIALLSGEWIWEIDRFGNFLYCSEKVESILGYSPTCLLKRRMWDTIHEEHMEENRSFFHQLIHDPQIYRNKELWCRSISGEKVCIHSSGTPLWDEHGNLKGYRGLNVDVTLQKQQEESNYWKQYYLEALMDTIPDAIYFKDKNSHFLKINKALAVIFGIQNTEEAKGKSDADYFNEEHASKTYRDEQEIIRTGNPIIAKEEQEIWSARPTSWVSTTKMPLHDEKGIVIGTFGISRNITESKRMMEAIERRILALTRPFTKDDPIHFDDLFDFESIQLIQDQFSLVAGVASIITLPDGTPITKPSNFTRFCYDLVRSTSEGCLNCKKSDALFGKPNPTGPTIGHCLSCGLWDAGASILVGEHHIANWLIGQVRDESLDESAIQAYAKQIGVDEQQLVEAFYEVPAMSEEHFLSVSNTLFTLAKNLSTMAYQNLQQARFIAERDQSEEALRQNEVLLKELIATKDRFFSIIAHDLRSPFNSILGFSDLLQSKLTEHDLEKATEYCGIIQKSASNTMELLDNLLDWARSQSSKLDFNPVNLDLNNLVHTTVNLFSESAKQKKIRLLMDTPSRAMVTADKSMLGTVLRNLTSNALKFTMPGGAISISVKKNNRSWQVSVSDNGVGMSADELNKLFRIDEVFTTKGTQGEHGTGLGLILCKEFVSKHGGDLWAESEPEKGSTFYFSIPIQAKD